MEELYRQIVIKLRSLMARILEPHLDFGEFLAQVAGAAKELDPHKLEARVYEVNFIENTLYLQASTEVDLSNLSLTERLYVIKPMTITGDAIIENKTIIASKTDGYAHSRFKAGEEVRAAFPIEFFDPEMPEGRTRYVLVVDKKGAEPLSGEIIAALQDFSILAGLTISIKELRDTLGQYYQQNRNLVLTGRHSAAVAHDIRSLNTGVGGFLNLALRHLDEGLGEDGLRATKRHITFARDNSRQIETLLMGIAHFTKQGISLNRDTDLAEALGKKIDSLANRADFGRRLEFDASLSEGRTGFLVDRDWFGTVIDNLVKNSFEACSGRTRIIIKLDANPDRVTLTLEDNCGGIPMDILPEIFTPFRSDKKKGQGLGLANARKVVEEHGGSISVENHPGQGAVFTIEFSLHSD